MDRVLSCCFVGLAVLGATGCQTAGAGQPASHYFGLVTVHAPGADAGNVSRTDVRVLGAWVDASKAGHGPSGGVGWRRARLLSAPADCRLVIIVDSDAQVASAEALLKRFSEGEKPCVTRP